MSLESQRKWLHLALVPEMDFENFYRLLKTFGLPENIFSQTFSALSSVVPQSIALSIRGSLSESREQRLTKILKLLDTIPTARLVVPSDEDYPQKFLSIARPPLVTLSVGQLSLLNRPTVGFVGSSHPSKEGLAIAKSWAQAILNNPVSLIQGDSEGIENIALKSAIQKDAQSLVIVTKNILSDPLCEKKLRFASENGLLLASLENEGNPWASRQKLMIACIEHFVVIEAGIRSKVLSLVREAADEGRDVMAVPGSIHSPLSKGCHKLIREGAKLVESVDDIVVEMRN